MDWIKEKSTTMQNHFRKSKEKLSSWLVKTRLQNRGKLLIYGVAALFLRDPAHLDSKKEHKHKRNTKCFQKIWQTPPYLQRSSAHTVAEWLIHNRSQNITGPFVYHFYGPNRPNNVMKKRPLYSETINNYWACLVSCCPDADREGRQTTRRHIKASR